MTKDWIMFEGEWCRKSDFSNVGTVKLWSRVTEKEWAFSVILGGVRIEVGRGKTLQEAEVSRCALLDKLGIVE